MIKTKVLGTDYEVELVDLNDLPNNDGLCKTYEKKILVRKPECFFGGSESDDVCRTRFREVLCHELIHSYCAESAVFYDDNENLVDWIAMMLPKIVKSDDEVIGQLKEIE